MKLLYCELCGDMVSLAPHELRGCCCGNTRGKYVTKNNIQIEAIEPAFVRIVGIHNVVLKGKDKNYANNLFKVHNCARLCYSDRLFTRMNKTKDTELIDWM